MKSILANLLIGSLFSAAFVNPALANTLVDKPSEVSKSAISVKLLTYQNSPTFFDSVNLIDRIISIQKFHAVNFNNFSLNSPSDRILRIKQQPFTHQYEKEDVILGFQNPFWSNQNQRYWGVTTIEHLGKNRSRQQLNLSKLNYIDESPSLIPGSAALTISGGGKQNLATNTATNTLRKLEDFQGGVTYHQSLSNDVTVGVGLVYENLLLGFSQFTYQSNFLPLRTTVSLLTGDRGLEVHSHVRFKPSNDFIVNYYNEREKQRFDLNWAMVSGLSLTARGNSQEESLSAGLKVAVKNEYFSLFAKAELGNNDNWNWRLNSRLGSLELIYAANKVKTQSEISLNVLDSLPTSFDCSFFLKYETRHSQEETKNLTVWGGSLHSKSSAERERHIWKFDLGYGFGSQGNGAIASTSIGLRPNLSLKLTYEEVSTLSDDTNIKLQLAQ